MRNNEERFGSNKNIQDSSVPLSNALNFVVPTEFVELPSKGKFYPAGHPLKNCETVEIKQMTAKEEDILTSKSLLKKGVALDKLIASLLVDKSVDPESLTIEDRNAIIVSARISGYGPNYATTVGCPGCEQKTKYSFNLSDKVEKEESEEENDFKDIEIDENGFFSIELPATKWKVVLKALNGFDEKTTLKLAETKKKSSNDSFLIDQLLLMIVSLQDVKDQAVLHSALSAMPASDSRYLRRAYSQVVKRFDLTQKFYCSNCGHEADLEVPLSADFFWFK